MTAPSSRLLSTARVLHLAGTVEDCGVAAILLDIVKHHYECDKTSEFGAIVIDQKLADLLRAIMLLAGTQDRGWRESALHTLAALMLEDLDNPNNLTVTQ